jgi:hypothetical protein
VGTSRSRAGARAVGACLVTSFRSNDVTRLPLPAVYFSS